MISNFDDFKGLLIRVREGDESAAEEFVERYGEDIRNAVRRSLNRKLRPKFDSLDFVQLVWSSFFRKDSFAERFAGPEDLIAYLVVMARNKVGMETRRRLISQKFNVNREASLERGMHGSPNDLPSSSPAPIECAIAKERWDHLMSCSPKNYKEIIQFRLQGRTCQDIADRLDLDESTVRRFLKRLQKKDAE